MINLNTVWAFFVGGCVTAIVHKVAEDDGKREGIGEGLCVGVAIGQELVSDDTNKPDISSE